MTRADGVWDSSHACLVLTESSALGQIIVGTGLLGLVIVSVFFWWRGWLFRTDMLVTRLLLIALVLSVLGPQIANQAGWFVAEYGRQPWAVGEVLPTHLAASALTAGQIWTSLALISALYTLFLVIEIWLMQHFARKGPSALHTGKYDLENGKAQEV